MSQHIYVEILQDKLGLGSIWATNPGYLKSFSIDSILSLGSDDYQIKDVK